MAFCVLKFLITHCRLLYIVLVNIWCVPCPLAVMFCADVQLCIATYERAMEKVSLACETSDLATEASDVERQKSRKRR